MTNKNLTISIILATIVTAIILLLPISLSNTIKCMCGGCCIGCPGDCNTIGTPFAYYYWGINGISKEVVKQISLSGIVANSIIWVILMLLIHKFVYKKIIKK